MQFRVKLYAAESKWRRKMCLGKCIINLSNYNLAIPNDIPCRMLPGKDKGLVSSNLPFNDNIGNILS